jgi:hypothetical protein
MLSPKLTPRKSVPDSEVHKAQRYLDSLLADQDENALSPEEIDDIRQSIEGIRRGDLTVEEFERKYGF